MSMIDNCNYAIDHRLQPIHIMNEVIHSKGMIVEKVEIPLFHKRIIREVNNITGEVIIGHIHHSETETNKTRPEVNSITDKMGKIDRVRVFGAVIGADLLVEEYSPTAGRLEMIREFIDLEKELKKQSLPWDIQKMTQEVANVDHAPMKNHALRDSAGQPQ